MTRIMTPGPEPLGLKLQIQAFMLNDPAEKENMQKLIVAMRETLDNIEEHGLIGPEE